MYDDWFTQAAKQASSTKQARATRRASAEREMQAAKELREARVARISKRPSPEARAAAAEFGETTAITPDQALGAIERLVSSSEDPVAAAGEWITKITNSLSAIAREHLEVQ